MVLESGPKAHGARVQVHHYLPVLRQRGRKKKRRSRSPVHVGRPSRHVEFPRRHTSLQRSTSLASSTPSYVAQPAGTATSTTRISFSIGAGGSGPSRQVMASWRRRRSSTKLDAKMGRHAEKARPSKAMHGYVSSASIRIL